MAPRSAGWSVVSAALAFGRMKPTPDDVSIAIMGVTGAGKSSFIKRVTQREDIVIGHGLTSETMQCQPYRFAHAGTNFAIIDTPGFNDTFLDDAAILSELASFMETTYKDSVKLTAIIYLHPITNDRFEGSARDNFRMFRKLCGPNFYPNVVLATSCWSFVDEDVGQRRQTQLEENEEFWGEMKRKGSKVVRLPDERDACIELLLQLAGKERIALKIQEELVDQQLPISSTEAASTSKNVLALQQEFQQKIAALQEQHTAEMLEQQAEYERIQHQHIEAFEAEMRKHQEQIDKAREANAVLVREAEERRGKILQEQQELIERTRLETEKVRAELEQLALQGTDKQANRDVDNKQGDAEAAALARKAHMASQLTLLNSAKTAGTVKANISMSFEELRRPFCDKCGYRCDAQLAYTCAECKRFDICSRCAETSPSCFDDSHTAFARRSFVGTDLGRCRRALNPIQTRFRLPCDSCSKMFDRGSFAFHCCSCNNDKFELCLDCVIRGQTCLDLKHHTLQYMIM